MTMDTAQIESSHMLQQIMQGLMEGVVITDRRGRLVFANRAMEQLLGYEPGELVGLPWSVLFPEQASGQLETWRIRSLYAPTSPFEARLLHKNGTLVPALAHSRPLSEGGHLEGLLSTFSDQRESQNLQTQIQQLAKPAFMGQHMASIIHELSNSLTILFLQAQWLSRKAPMTPALEKSLQSIRDEAKRMIQMVDELRATADPTQVQLETTDVNGLLQRTLVAQSRQLDSDGIRLETRLDPNLPETAADPYRLQQVFVNLINNARQAIRETAREGWLSVSTKAVAYDGEGQPRIQVRVADNGPGIAEEIMPRLFEAFFTTKSGDGMGLGLFICQQIVAKHEGRIWAENNPEGGTTFVVELPTKEPANLQAMALSDDLDPRPSEASDSRRDAAPCEHILVVDDEPVVAQTIGFFLKEAGFQVTTATDARQALLLLDQKPIDVIVSDLSMPGMSGPELWQAVHERFPGLAGRIIFSTGDSGRQKWRAFFENTDCATIVKPFPPDALIRLIQETLVAKPEKGPLSRSPVSA